MQNKDRLRKKYFFIRKRKYFDIKPSFFNPLIQLINETYKKKNINLSSYYPSSFEVNVLKLFEVDATDRMKIFLPVVTGNNSMHFCKWGKYDVLQVNTFGMLEPFISFKNIVPNVMLIPLLAYDNQNNRLGYGGGFYDRYLEKVSKIKKIFKIGLGFSYQEIKKIPINKYDKKLDLIITEKKIIQ